MVRLYDANLGRMPITLALRRRAKIAKIFRFTRKMNKRAPTAHLPFGRKPERNSIFYPRRSMCGA
jgi:hypothetical protein